MSSFVGICFYFSLHFSLISPVFIYIHEYVNKTICILDFLVNMGCLSPDLIRNLQL